MAWEAVDLDALALLLDAADPLEFPTPQRQLEAAQATNDEPQLQAPRAEEQTPRVRHQHDRKPATKRPNSYDSNRARAERRRELVALRERVQALEGELAVLRDAKRRATFAIRADGTGQPSRAAVIWREIAERQIEQRVAAESERCRLTQRVAAQAKRISGLQQLAFCRASLKALEGYVGDRISRSHLGIFEPLDMTVFVQLATEVERCYAEIDNVFLRDEGLIFGSAGNAAFRRTDSSGNLYFQVFGSKIFPFDVQRTGAAAWKRFSKSVRPHDTNIFQQFFGESEDTVTEWFATELSHRHEKAVVLAQQVKRLYRESDRLAIIWHSHVEAVSFMDKPLTGAKFQERGYFLLERPPAAPDGFTVLRTCYMIEPDVPTQFVPHDSIAFTLTEFVFKWMAATIPANHQILEDMLVLSSLAIDGRMCQDARDVQSS